MSERSILFSAPMIKKLLSGYKTQTRRIVTTEWNHGFKPSEFFRYTKRPLKREDGDGDFVTLSEPYSKIHGEPVWFYSWGNARWLRCPYGKVGDTIWVRETWQYADWTEDGYPYVRYRADDSKRLCETIDDEWAERLTDIWAGLSEESNYKIDGRAADRRWRPAIHMPRWASRLALKITDVRLQPLMDITNEDARAEGFKGWDSHTEGPTVPIGDGYTMTQCGEYVSDSGAFLIFWDKLHGDGSTYDNPWVWALTFEVLQGGAAVAREAHNLEVGGSNPSPASPDNSTDQS